MAAVASRYARALVEVVLEKKIDPASAVQQVNSIVDAVNESADLRKVWESPAVPAAQKRRLLDAIVAVTGASQSVRNFYAVLIDHHRVRMLKQIARQFEVELNKQLGIAEAQVTSARQLSDQEKRELEARVAALTGMQVRAKYASDPELLGGVKVQVGSTIYDGSVRGQLQKMREQLVNS